MRTAEGKTELHHEVHGRAGPFLLLVHGLLSSRAQWRPNLTALTQHFRPVVVELLGHGRSPSPDERDAYQPSSYVDGFEALRESLGAERWLVCGQSLGAALTLRYVLAHPERVRAHLMTNSNSAFATKEWAEAVRPGMEVLRGRLLAEGRQAIESVPIHPKNARSLPPEAKAELVADCELHDPVGIGFTASVTVPSSPVREDARHNRVPTLLVHGTRERRFRGHAVWAAANVPQLEVVPVEAGHAVNLEAPRAFDDAVSRWVLQTGIL